MWDIHKEMSRLKALRNKMKPFFTVAVVTGKLRSHDVFLKSFFTSYTENISHFLLELGFCVHLWVGLGMDDDFEGVWGWVWTEIWEVCIIFSNFEVRFKGASYSLDQKSH